MKTDELIEALVQDAARPRHSLAQRVLSAILIGGLCAGLLFVLGLGMRPDIASAFETWRFVFKFGLTLICAVCAWWACIELSRPDVRLRDVAGWLLLVPALLVLAVVYELVAIPPAQWVEKAIGNYAFTCIVAIPLLSILPLVALLAALRWGAPRVPARAGAVAGLLAGSLSAALYATHCPDDSPLFVGVWYSLALGLVVLMGALAGHRALRW